MAYLDVIAKMGSQKDVESVEAIYEKVVSSDSPLAGQKRIGNAFQSCMMQIENQTPQLLDEALASSQSGDAYSFQEELMNDASGVNGPAKKAAAIAILTATSDFSTDN